MSLHTSHGKIKLTVGGKPIGTVSNVNLKLSDILDDPICRCGHHRDEHEHEPSDHYRRNYEIIADTFYGACTHKNFATTGPPIKCDCKEWTWKHSPILFPPHLMKAFTKMKKQGYNPNHVVINSGRKAGKTTLHHMLLGQAMHIMMEKIAHKNYMELVEKGKGKF